MTTEERLAILENELEHSKKDNNKFFEFLRASMAKESEDREEIISLMQKLKTRVDRQTFFVSGVGFSIIVVWSVYKVFL